MQYKRRSASPNVDHHRVSTSWTTLRNMIPSTAQYSASRSAAWDDLMFPLISLLSCLIRSACTSLHRTVFPTAALANRSSRPILTVQQLAVVVCTPGFLSLSFTLLFFYSPHLSDDILVMVQTCRCISYRELNPDFFELFGSCRTILF